MINKKKIPNITWIFPGMLIGTVMGGVIAPALDGQIQKKSMHVTVPQVPVIEPK